MPTKLTAPSDDAVRTRAYLMWEADGKPFGNDGHYWGLALAELSAAAKPKRAAASSKAPEKKAKVIAKKTATKVAAATKRANAAAKSAKPKKK
jgi:hypothetical protein